jgi:hypothetical protein
VNCSLEEGSSHSENRVVDFTCHGLERNRSGVCVSSLRHIRIATYKSHNLIVSNNLPLSLPVLPLNEFYPGKEPVTNLPSDLQINIE